MGSTSSVCGHAPHARRQGHLRRRGPRALQPGVHGGRRRGRGRRRRVAVADRRGGVVRVPGRAEEFALPLAAPLAELLETVVAGGSVTLCTQCAARREITAEHVLPGVRIAGGPAAGGPPR